MWHSWSNWESLGAPPTGPLTSPPFLVHDNTGWWVAYARGQNGDLEINVQTRDIIAEPQVLAISNGQAATLQVSWGVPADEACSDDFLAIFAANQTDNSKYLDFLFVNGKQNPSGNPVTQGAVKFNVLLNPGMYLCRPTLIFSALLICLFRS